MKGITQYIFEKSWTLKEYERSEFAAALGTMLGVYGEDDEIKVYSDFKKSLTDDEIKTLESVVDALDDTEVYKSAKRSMFKDELPLLKRFAKWLEDNDIANKFGSTNWDLIDAYEKILEY